MIMYHAAEPTPEICPGPADTNVLHIALLTETIAAPPRRRSQPGTWQNESNSSSWPSQQKWRGLRLGNLVYDKEQY